MSASLWVAHLEILAGLARTIIHYRYQAHNCRPSPHLLPPSILVLELGNSTVLSAYQTSIRHFMHTKMSMSRPPDVSNTLIGRRNRRRQPARAEVPNLRIAELPTLHHMRVCSLCSYNKHSCLTILRLSSACQTCSKQIRLLLSLPQLLLTPTPPLQLLNKNNMAPRQVSPRHMPNITLPHSYNDLNSTWTCIRTHHHAPEPGVIILTLYRPGKHNAFTDTMRREIEAAYAMFDADARVKCIVVTGDGRIFCAGADLDVGFGEGTTGEGAERVQEHRDGYATFRPQHEKQNVTG